MNATIKTAQTSPQTGTRERLRAHLSVFYLMVRSRFLHICLLLVALVAVEIGLFSRTLATALARADVASKVSVYEIYEQLLSRSGIPWVFGACFLLVTARLATIGVSGSSRTDYTLRRLAVSERTVCLWQAAFAAVCYLLLMLVQITVAYGLGQWYVSAVGEIFPTEVSDQTLFLAFYRSDLLHSLLPLADWSRWLSLVTTVAGLSLATAHFGFCRRYGKRNWRAILLVILTVVYFVRPMGERVIDIWMVTSVNVYLSCTMLRMLWKGGSRHEES